MQRSQRNLDNPEFAFQYGSPLYQDGVKAVLLRCSVATRSVSVGQLDSRKIYNKHVEPCDGKIFLKNVLVTATVLKPFCFWITATVDLREQVDYGDIKSKESLLPFQQHSFISLQCQYQHSPKDKSLVLPVVAFDNLSCQGGLESDLV